MKGYLTPASGGRSGSVPVDGRTGIYRDPDRGQEVVVEREGEVSSLGVADATVSRKKDGAPVVLEPRAECIEVRNRHNTNGVVIETDGHERELDSGFSARIRRDATLELGFNAAVRLTVEREAREEYVIEGDVQTGGDVVMGDREDNGTVVEDVVAKELNVGDDGDGPAEVRDAVANEMNVGVDAGAESDTGDPVEPDAETTQHRCERHDVMYAGEECPKCAAERRQQSRGDGAGSAGGAAETKYCLFCGDEIPEQARVCPACGEDLPDA